MGDGAPCLFEYSDQHDSIRTFCANGYNANKDALTQSLFLKSDDVDFTDPYARGFRTSEVRKPLKELTTDFTSLFFFEKKQCRITFLKFIIQVFKCFCENIVRAHDQQGRFKAKWSDYMNVMFKGGVVIRLALLSCSRNILKRNAASALDKKLKKYLKVSDFDFELHGVASVLQRQQDSHENHVLRLHDHAKGSAGLAREQRRIHFILHAVPARSRKKGV